MMVLEGAQVALAVPCNFQQTGCFLQFTLLSSYVDDTVWPSLRNFTHKQFSSCQKSNCQRLSLLYDNCKAFVWFEPWYRVVNFFFLFFSCKLFRWKISFSCSSSSNRISEKRGYMQLARIYLSHHSASQYLSFSFQIWYTLFCLK